MLFNSLIFLCISVYIGTSVPIHAHPIAILEEIQNDLQKLMDGKVRLESATMTTVEIPSSNKEECSRSNLKIYIQHLKLMTPANGVQAQRYLRMLVALEKFSNTLLETGLLPQNEQQNCKTLAVKIEDLLQHLKEFLQNENLYLHRRP